LRGNEHSEEGPPHFLRLLYFLYLLYLLYFLYFLYFPSLLTTR
jgi:hypothetical protein